MDLTLSQKELNISSVVTVTQYPGKVLGRKERRRVGKAFILFLPFRSTAAIGFMFQASIVEIGALLCQTRL